MSDTKILSGEEFKRQVELCLNGNIQAHERILAHQAAMLPSRAKEGLPNLLAERDAALLRAEAAEAQVKALLEAMPGERAEEIAQRRYLANTWQGWKDAEELRAYAAAAKPEGEVKGWIIQMQ